MATIWFITGSSRGLGRTLTEAVLADGGQVAATARDPQQLNDLVQQYPGQVLPLQLDVTNKDQIHSAVQQTVAHFGRIDVLVNNAGFGITGAAEAFTDEQVRSQLETNLYAPIEISRAVIPYMRKQRSGRIVQISSIGGRTGSIGVGIYQAAKWGVSGFTEVIAAELAPLGIKVTSVEPGGFRTNWAGASMTYAPAVEGYEDTVDKRIALFQSGQFVPQGDPVKAARVIIELSRHPEPPVHLILGSDAAAMLQQADAKRKAEFEKWLDVTRSTDHDDAEDFSQSAIGKAVLSGKS